MRALLCDDDATVRLIARRLLEDRFGCEVVECGDGAEALTRLGEAPCQFAILDVDMPGMGGLETLEEIRASEETRDLPVVILTAERDQETVVRLVQQGVSQYIVKPLRHDNFVTKVEALLKGLSAEHVKSGARSIRASAGEATLVVDGDARFRQVLADAIRPFGAVVEAESGAAALVAFRKAPARLVFVGAHLGVMSAERVAEKIRGAGPRAVRLVRIVESASEDGGPSFDGALLRSTSPRAVARALQPFFACDTSS